MKEAKALKFGMAFGMARAKLGYIVKEQLTFVITDDEERNRQIVADFAKQHKCNIVEVWFRTDDNWNEFTFYKMYNFYSTLPTETIDKLDIYKKI